MTRDAGQERAISVALEYKQPAAPRVIAIGHGEVAERIVAVAKANGIPLTENGPLAVALSKLPLDQEVPEKLYRAVAEVLNFILRTSNKLR